MKFKCDLCNKYFSRHKALQSHNKTFHMNDKEKFCCETCGGTFACKDTLSIHEKTIHEWKGEMYKCSSFSCEKQFKSIAYLKMHIRRVHDSSTNEQIECELCGYTVKHHKKHMKTVHNEMRNVKCEICSKTISCIGNLKIHMATHEKRHKCDSCEEAFSNPTLLRHHFNKFHTSTKCDICDVEFTCQEYLRRHIAEAHSKLKVLNKGPKYDRRAKISSFKNKEEIDSEEVCLVCNKSRKLSSILPHLLRYSKNCGVDYPKEAFEDLKVKCNKYKTQRNLIYCNKKYHGKMLLKEEKLLSKSEEQSSKYIKQYLPQLL